MFGRYTATPTLAQLKKFYFMYNCWENGKVRFISVFYGSNIGYAMFDTCTESPALVLLKK